MKEIRCIQIDSTKGAPKQFQKEELGLLVNFLELHLSQHYILINTILGLDIYYDASDKDHSEFIAGIRTVLHKISASHPLRFQQVTKREEVLALLLEKLENYRKNPQLFLIYVKNYIRRSNAQHLAQTFKDKLSAFLDYVLLEIAQREDIPHYAQILKEKERYANKLTVSTSAFTRDVLRNTFNKN